MSEARIRSANASDLPELVRIYNHYVVETPITFDVEPFSIEGRLPWFEAYSESGPYRLLVAEDDGRIAGYATSSRFRTKPAYDPSVETTIYLDPARVGRGHGRRLYAALLEILAKEPGVHLALAGITLPNPASVALHVKLGFRPIGIFHEVGHKLDRYWDVSWYERPL